MKARDKRHISEADALGVNDKRFNPFYIFADVEAPGRVEFYVG